MTPRAIRTPEQIHAECEKRLAEMEAEYERRAANPVYTRPCKSCRWSDGEFCRQPLIIGLDRKLMWTFDRKPGDADLCGPEKALWQPIGARLRFWEWPTPPMVEGVATALVFGALIAVAWIQVGGTGPL